MAVYFVSKALCAMGGGLVLLPTSDVKGIFYNVAGTYKIPNYPHALSHTVCGDHKRVAFFRNAVLYFLMRLVSLSIFQV